MKNIKHIPINDYTRIQNRRPETVKQWLDVQGLTADMFTKQQLESIQKGLDKMKVKK